MEPSDTTTLDRAFQDYQRLYLAARNLAQRTRREYSDDLQDLLAFLHTSLFLTRPSQVQWQHLQAYLADLDRRGFAGTSRRRKVAAIRSYFAFLEQAGLLPHRNPAHSLIPPERDNRPPRVLTEGEYQRLRLACAHSPRDAALIEVALQTGARLSELARLTVPDVELPAQAGPDQVGSLYIAGKGKSERTITLNSKACQALQAYLAVRPPAADSHLFLTRFGKGMTPRSIEYLVGKYLDQAGIPRASVSTLRHTFAAQMVKKGTHLDVVRQALGHKSTKTTAIYLDLARQVMEKELQANAL